MVLDSNGFQRNLELGAFLQIVSGDYVGHVHGAPGLLQIEPGGIIFAGGVANGRIVNERT
jgi:hypothetical protein